MARYWVVFLVGACLLLVACEPVAIALLGAGAGDLSSVDVLGVGFFWRF